MPQLEVYAALFARIDAAELRLRSNGMVHERLRDVGVGLTQAARALRQLQEPRVSVKLEENAEQQSHRRHHRGEAAATEPLVSSIGELQRQLSMKMAMLAAPYAQAEPPVSEQGEMKWSILDVKSRPITTDPPADLAPAQALYLASETETEDEEEDGFESHEQAHAQHLSPMEHPTDTSNPVTVHNAFKQHVDACVVSKAELKSPKVTNKRLLTRNLMAALHELDSFLRSVSASMRDNERAVPTALLSQLKSVILAAVTSIDRMAHPKKAAKMSSDLLSVVSSVCDTSPRFHTALKRARESLVFQVENGEAPIDPKNETHRLWRQLPEQCLTLAERVSAMPPSPGRKNEVTGVMNKIHRMFAILIERHKVSTTKFRENAQAQFKRAVELAVQCIIDNPLPNTDPHVNFLRNLTLAANSNDKMNALLRESESALKEHLQVSDEVVMAKAPQPLKQRPYRKAAAKAKRRQG
ncbi:unnamed protein product [Globisporangium polare]